MRVAWQRNLLARRRRSRLLARVAGAVFSLIYLTVAAIVASGTYAWCNSRAGPSVSTFQAVEGTEIFELSGSFDEDAWLEGKGSGLYVTNLTDSDLWVYFTVSGSLRDLVQPVNPIQLAAGEKAEIPLAVDQHSDMALLAWRNQDAVFQGKITARVYNNFVSREFEGIRISAARLYDAVVGGQKARVMALAAGSGSDAAADLALEDITSVDDLQRLLEQNRARGRELERLQEETENQRGIIAALEDKIAALIEKISALTEENNLLGSLLDSLKARSENPSSSGGSDSSIGDQGSGTGTESPPAEPPEITEPATLDSPSPEPEEPPQEEPGENGADQETGSETGDQTGGDQEDLPVNTDEPPEEPPVLEDPPIVDDPPMAEDPPVIAEPPLAEEPPIAEAPPIVEDTPTEDPHVLEDPAEEVPSTLEEPSPADEGVNPGADPADEGSNGAEGTKMLPATIPSSKRRLNLPPPRTQSQPRNQLLPRHSGNLAHAAVGGLAESSPSGRPARHLVPLLTTNH